MAGLFWRAAGLTSIGLLWFWSSVAAHDSGFGLARYTPDGSLDTTFGVNGVVVTRSTQRSFVANALALQPDGKILIAGMVSDLASASIQLALARYTPDGRLDSGFGTDGTATTLFGAAGALANAVALQPDGMVLVAGVAFSHGETPDQFVVARYTAHGQPDVAFGSAGVVTTRAGVGGSSAQALVVLPDGRIVVAGTVFANGTTDDNFALARYTADGRPDPQFAAATDGVTTTDFGSLDSGGGGSLDRAGALAVRPDGRILVAGTTRGDRQAFSVASYNPDGTLDASFGVGGKAQVETVDPQVFGILLEPSGDILLAGAAGSSVGGTAPFAVVRLRPDGRPDQRFGSDGKGVATTSFEGSRSGARAVAIQPDGKLLAAGAKFGAPSSQGDALNQSGFAVTRYTRDGSVDTGFGLAGRVVTEMGDAGAMPLSLVVQPDGKIIAAGLVFFKVPTAPEPNPLGAMSSIVASIVAVGLVAAIVIARRYRMR